MNELERKTKAVCWAVGLAASATLALVAGCGPSVESRPASARNLPLSYGWKFACAITNSAIDLSDRSQSQKKVALAYLAEGDVETARSYAAQIEDWNKGMALAAIAEWLATHGETAKAEAMLPELEASGFTAKDWQRDWIRSAITRVQALLGREQDVTRGASQLASHPNLGGDAAANMALLLSRTGRVDEAISLLNDLPKTNNLDVALSRAQGYRELLVAGRLNRNTATQVVMNAWEAAGLVRPYRRWELQLQIIDAMATNGLAAEARERLDGVSSNIAAAVKLPPEVHALMLSQGANLWNRLGEPKKGEELLGEAEKVIGRKLEAIFQPAAYANVAEAYAAAGDMAQARALYIRALDMAAELANRRPRAIAGVDVCVSLAGHKEVIDAGIQKGLDRLLATFHATQP